MNTKGTGQRSSHLITRVQSHSHEKTMEAEQCRSPQRDADAGIQLVAGCKHSKNYMKAKVGKNAHVLRVIPNHCIYLSTLKMSFYFNSCQNFKPMPLAIWSQMGTIDSTQTKQRTDFTSKVSHCCYLLVFH